MRWFKHDSDAGNDAKLRKLRLKYGAQGYGIYWYCLELIARNVDKHNLTFQLEHDADLIADDFKLSGEFVQEMMAYMVNLGLFENIQGVITCLKMSNRTDEYTQQLMRELKYSHDKLPRTSESVPRISEVREEKRREEIVAKQKILLLPDGTFSNINGEIEVWKSAYQNVDILIEIKKAGAWCISNPKKAPKINFSRFINSWLSRCQPEKQDSQFEGIL